MPKVVFKNKPPQSEHEVDQKFNAMRLEFIPHIEQFVAKHDQFKDEVEVSITFAQEGYSSIVAIIETPHKKLVLKIPRSKEFSAGEGKFLMKWKEAGAIVPHVEEIGEINGHPYILMEFIDAPTLKEAYSAEELIDRGIYKNMGKLLRLMHKPKAYGYGFVVEDNPEFQTAKDWLEGEDMQKRLNYVAEYNLPGTLHDTLPKILKIIEVHSAERGSSYCHDDFNTSNIFATESITVFDPNPKFNNGYYDLGRTLMGHIAFGQRPEVNEQLIEGYFGNTDYSKKALYAYIFLAFCMKFPYWHNKKLEEQLTTILNYLENNIKLLTT